MKFFKEFLESLVEPLARELAAEEMNLKDDPLGEKLPDELWKQREANARKIIGL